jgi:ABC-type transporter Mla subunit MlaD
MTTIAARKTVFDDVKPFPAAAAIGHNRPPIQEQGVTDFNQAIDGHDGLRKRITDLIDSATRATATNDDTAGRCAELIRQMSAVEKVVDSERVSVKQPYLDAGRNIDASAKTLVALLSDSKAKVRGIAETYMRDKAAREAAEARRMAEIARQEREEAEARAHAEAALAAVENRVPDPEIMEAPAVIPIRQAPPETTQVRSDFGAVASARKTKVAVITDWDKAFKSVRTVPAVQEAIQRAVQALVRAGQTDIAGVKIREEIGMSVR